MDSIEKLTTAISMVEEARGVPLSASCVLHRGEILEILDGARSALPNDLEAARKIMASRDALIEEGRLSSEALIASAREEVSRMIERTDRGRRQTRLARQRHRPVRGCPDPRPAQPRR